MPSLIDLKTDLKSLRYGKDTLGGGDSGQPYVQTPIPDSFNDLGANEDFILRGGINAAKDSLTDIKRLGKMFTDTKSPNGLIFISKQQILSRTAVRTQTSGILNEGIYSPLNTLAQAGVVAFGGHLNKQGINPFAQTGAYAAGINNEHLYNVKVKPTQPIGKNRLVEIYDKKQGIKIDDTNVLTYTGGPGSILGIGNTNIRFADKRTGINNALLDSNPNYFNGKYISKNNPDSSKYLKTLFYNTAISENTGVTGKYYRLTKNLGDKLAWLPTNINPLGTPTNDYFHNVYQPAIEGNTWPENSPLINAQNTYTYNQEDIIQTENNVGKLTSSPKIQDFRQKLRDSKNPQKGLTIEQAKQTGQLAESQTYNIEGAVNFTQRVNIGDPGQRGANSYADYTKGVLIKNSTSSPYDYIGGQPAGLDKINSLPIYRSEAVDTSYPINDFVKFRIAVIDNDSPNYKTFMHFRAFLGPISDNYNATWNSTQYLGRGEQFYTYGGFNRQISLSWTVAAQSKQELIPMYKKLNYLASTLAPDYSPNGYMRGNLVQLTIGGYLYEQPGFITGLTYEMGEDSPWEIGIGTTPGSEDGTVKELTQIIRVTGFSFTPIQNFIPRKQQLRFSTNTTTTTGDDTGFVSSYPGNERFISLANGPNVDNNNYGNTDTSN